MADLPDDLFDRPSTPANPGAAPRRKCSHDRPYRETVIVAAPVARRTWKCTRCGHLADPDKIRGGSASRRRGHRGELRSRDRYGWEKIGQRGGITDLRGTLMKVQQKTTAGYPPVTWSGIFAALEQVRDDRVAAILLSYVRPGRPADDYIVIRGADWLRLHGEDAPPAKETE